MTTFHRFVLPAIAAALLLAACGGGGSGDRDRSFTASQQTAPSPPPPAALRAARHFHERTAVTFHRQPGGHDAQDIVDYLRAASGAGGPAHELHSESATFLATYTAPPIVRLASDTPRELRALADRAVDAINRWLPYGKRLRIGPDIAPLTPLDDIPRGQIVIDYAHPRHWRPARTDFIGWAHSRVTRTDNGLEKFASRIWVDPAHPASVTTTTMHELLHALAVSGHISSRHFPTTIMASRSENTPKLPAIDGDALLAAYTRIPTGTLGDDISLETLGPWATETMHLQGRIAAPGNTVDFGVWFRNGLARPWFRGFQPDTDIADNPTLAGSVEWNGTLLGFTAEGRSAAGATRIALDLDTLDGTADFTDIETWNGAPGAQGSGAAWRDLAYTITATGNSFRNTAGDAGELRGRFTGNRHQGAAGTLERTDLSGAFAAAR